MKRIGFIGLGDMGMGMCKNLIKNGFSVKGFDLRQDRLANFKALGGVIAETVSDVAVDTDTIFIMVLNGKQVNDIVGGEGGIAKKIKAGTTVFITATIGPDYAKQAAAVLEPLGVSVMDMPVSGGRFGSEAGTLSLMTSGKKDVMNDHMPVLEAIGGKIYFVGGNVGDGQTVKACIQAYQGTLYEALFESMVLAEKAGLDLELFTKVLNESIVGCAVTQNTTRLIIDRKFVGTGSHISTMQKDINISMDLARSLGVPMYATSVAREMFQAGITAIPEGDNWCIVKLLETLAGVNMDDK